MSRLERESILAGWEAARVELKSLRAEVRYAAARFGEGSVEEAEAVGDVVMHIEMMEETAGELAEALAEAISAAKEEVGV